jgi:hypothetical protein
MTMRRTRRRRRRRRWRMTRKKRKRSSSCQTRYFASPFSLRSPNNHFLIIFY